MQFYVEAELFFRRAPHAKRDQLRLFGDRERRFAAICEEFQENVEVEQRERLRLDPRADYDEARQFLSEHGLNWKNARTVIGNFKRIWKTEEWDSLDSYKHTENGKTDYLIPKVLLKEIAEDVLARRSESRRKGWKTRQINSSV